MTQPRTYAPDEVLITVGGVQITGFSPDSIVKHEPDVDAVTKRVGADGRVTRTISANKSGRVTLTLAQSSPSNTFLHALLKADRAGKAGTVTYFMSDNNGSTIYASGYAWIVKEPENAHGSEAGDIEWMLDVAAFSDLSIIGSSDLS